MRSSSQEEVVEVFDALEAHMRRALELSIDVLTTPECLALLQRCETGRHQLPNSGCGRSLQAGSASILMPAIGARK